MEYFLTAVAFFLIFSAVILVHEAGHFFAAKIGKIKTEEFGFGLPPRIWGKRFFKNGTLFSINAIPFGGFVRLLGEDGKSKSKNSFSRRPMWARILTVVAGVLMNFALGIFLLAVGYFLGMKPIILDKSDFDAAVASGAIVLDDTRGVFVSGVVKNSPAEKSGIRAGDFITAIDVYPVERIEKFTEIQKRGLRGRYFHLSVLRKNPETHKIEKSFVALVAPDDAGKFGLYLTDEKPIIAEKEIKLSAGAALARAVADTGKLMKSTAFLLGDVVKTFFRHFHISENVGGPVAIAQITHTFVQIGVLSEILKLAAIISISVGVLNIMPFPALDGGRLALLLFELLTRKKPNPKFEKGLNIFGFLILIAFILLVTKNDVMRIFG